MIAWQVQYWRSSADDTKNYDLMDSIYFARELENAKWGAQIFAEDSLIWPDKTVPLAFIKQHNDIEVYYCIRDVIFHGVDARVGFYITQIIIH